MDFRLCAGLLACAICCAPAAAETPRAHVAARPAPTRPGIDGMWGSAYIMLLEASPKTPKLVVSEPEAAAIAAAAGGAISNAIALDPEVPWLVKNSRGLPIVRGERRTRLVVQPADGRAPFTAEARKEVEAGPQNAPADNPEQRPSAERCLVGGGQAPMTTLNFAGALLQILTTPDNVVLHTAYGNDVRVIRMTGEHGPSVLRSRLGDSIGHWEGPTLVIETVGLPNADRFRLFPFIIVSGDAKVIERLTPISDRELLYQFTIVDPKTYTGPWLGEFSWYRTDLTPGEYACHEGNYALPDILAGARYEEAAAKKALASGTR